MNLRETFQRRARESIFFARWARTTHDRKLFLEIARAWRGRADMTDEFVHIPVAKPARQMSLCRAKRIEAQN
jgi:hypothetical protein